MQTSSAAEAKTLTSKVNIHKKLARKVVGDIGNWREMAIFTYENTILKKFRVIPEILALAIAHEAWRQRKTRSIVILNTNHIDPDVALEIIDEFESPPSTFEFGIENISFNTLPRIKISFERLKTRGEILGKIIKGIAPEKNHKISEQQFEKVESVNELSELLIKTLKPPSISEILEDKLRQNKNKGKLTTVAQAVGIIGGLIFQPLAVAPHGLKMVQELVKAIQNGKEMHYKDWEKAIEKGFSAEKVKQIVDLRGMTPLVEGIEDSGWAVVLNTTAETMYEPLSLYMTWNAIETVSRELGEALGVLADGDSLIQIPAAGEVIRELVESEMSIRLAYIFRCKGGKHPENIMHIKKYISDRVVIFDMPTQMLAKLFENESATSTAILTKNLLEVVKAEKRGEIAFTSRNFGYKGRWKVEKVALETGFKARLKRIIIKIIELLNI
ncbi:MAG: hypothetical protein DRJ18_00815 [Candidatus Methanomethylicota archaeon]|nr:MAG: hypothetical protein DRJ18_00815 [Candidatus Verstraetearchaeota archaeon]